MNPLFRLLVLLVLVACSFCLGAGKSPAATAANPPVASAGQEYANLKLAITDLSKTFTNNYPRAKEFLSRMTDLHAPLLAGNQKAREDFVQLRREALLANPLLASHRVMLVKRKPKTVQSLITDAGRKIGFSGGPGREIGMPSNHECNSSLERDGYDNEICVLDPVAPEGALQTLYRPADGGYVGELDLHWDAARLLFSKSDALNWKVYEMRIDGSGLRQVSRMPEDVDSFDACYLPNGTILFGSTASFQAVPCWHGQKKVSNLYVMGMDGSGARQLCFDQDHNLHPTVLPNGQVLYHRWDYTGINHIFLRQLMLMNPDGTGQRAIYGSSSWYPNSLYFPRPLPGESSQLACILSGYHGVHRLGQFVLLDLNRGWQEAEGISLRISGRGDPINPIVKDNLVDADWPKFLHPEPLSDKYFLVAARPTPKSSWGIYLADIFDNLVLLREEPGYALLEPVLLRSRPRPPGIASQTRPSNPQATVYLHNVYAGPGLAGVPPKTVTSLRVLAYDFGYPGLAGPDLIGYGGPWEVMRILGTVPVEKDGSAMFTVPADTPIALQPLDRSGQAVQLMRSWFSARRGENISCVGCHERPSDTAAPTRRLAALKAPQELTQWHGPARGFDFEREVQPVLNRHCVSCHNGVEAPGDETSASLHAGGAKPDLRPTALVTNYAGRPISQLGIQRLHPEMRKATGGVMKYSPAYDALIHYVRRPGIEDDVSLLTPGEYQADTSPLIQMLRRGHHQVELASEDWERLFTWIDLNAPCHGTWGEVHPFPTTAHERRMAMRVQCGGPIEDPEHIPVIAPLPPVEPKHARLDANKPLPLPPLLPVSQPQDGPREKLIELADGVRLKLVAIPAGESVESNPAGKTPNRSGIEQPFWMSAFEVSNEQFRCFDPTHDPGYYTRRHARSDDKGLWLNNPQQPVVRVSWEEAMEFCQWLSERTGLNFTLPTEAQWEWACRGGSTNELSHGSLDTDFSTWANMADVSFTKGLVKDGKQSTGGLDHMVLEGAVLSDIRFNDGNVVTAAIGSYRPNTWGLHDMHGNAAEWTLSAWKGKPQDPFASDSERRIVRGGSFFDNPKNCRSAIQVDYPKWRRVFNVGFRVVCEEPKAAPVSSRQTRLN